MSDDYTWAYVNRGDWIYFLAPESLSAIKIGMVKSETAFASRFKQLQAMNHERLWCLGICSPGDYTLERELHKRFAHLHLHGEWFSPNNILIGFALMYRDAKRHAGILDLEEWLFPHDLLIALSRVYDDIERRNKRKKKAVTA